MYDQFTIKLMKLNAFFGTKGINQIEQVTPFT